MEAEVDMLVEQADNLKIEIMNQAIYAAYDKRSPITSDETAEYQRKYDQLKEAANSKGRALNNLPKSEDIIEAAIEIESKIEAKFLEVKAAESQLIENLNAAAK